jgi:5-methylcytosine-specific restriction enzyme A
MRICSGAGCLRAVPDDVRFCDECKPQAKMPDDIRTHDMGYTAELDRIKKSTRWQRLRDLVARAQPICQRCRKRPTQIIDHKVPAEIAVMQAQLSGKYLDKWAGYFMWSNLQGLCRLCHAAKTAEDKAHTGTWPDVIEHEARQPKRVWSF